MRPELSLVIPIYNEEAVLPQLDVRLQALLGRLGMDAEVVFVDDGSRDASIDILRRLAAAEPRYRVVGFSRNFGHQRAITAGMDKSRGAAVVVMDADLQDPPEVILDMVAKWREGYDVVFGRRRSRVGESWFKLFTAKIFYRLFAAMIPIEVPLDTGDFRLMSRRVVTTMRGLRETHRFVRGLVSWVGFRQTAVEYDREARAAGETKYPLRKMLAFALDGIASFSIQPLRFATYVGLFVGLASVVYAIVAIVTNYLGVTVPGWTTTVVLVSFLFSVQFFMIGVLGEYVGRIYEQVKRRPLYIVSEKVNFRRRHAATDASASAIPSVPPPIRSAAPLFSAPPVPLEPSPFAPTTALPHPVPVASSGPNPFAPTPSPNAVMTPHESGNYVDGEAPTEVAPSAPAATAPLIPVARPVAAAPAGPGAVVPPPLSSSIANLPVPSPTPLPAVLAPPPLPPVAPIAAPAPPPPAGAGPKTTTSTPRMPAVYRPPMSPARTSTPKMAAANVSRMPMPGSSGLPPRTGSAGPKPLPSKEPIATRSVAPKEPAAEDAPPVSVAPRSLAPKITPSAPPPKAIAASTPPPKVTASAAPPKVTPSAPPPKVAASAPPPKVTPSAPPPKVTPSAPPPKVSMSVAPKSLPPAKIAKPALAKPVPAAPPIEDLHGDDGFSPEDITKVGGDDEITKVGLIDEEDENTETAKEHAGPKS